MTNDPSGHSPENGELKQALQGAVARPFHQVDWERLHQRIMADAESRFRRDRARAYDWVAAWSTRGIPLATGALATAVVALWILPIPAPAREPPPPGFWPVAEELVSGLPEGTRHLLNAGDDVDSMLRAMVAYGGKER